MKHLSRFSKAGLIVIGLLLFMGLVAIASVSPEGSIMATMGMAGLAVGLMGATAGLEKSTKCTAAIATAFTIAKFGADDDTCSVAAASTDRLVGIFQHTTSDADDAVRVMLDGISELKLGGTVVRGDHLTSDASAQGVVAASELDTVICQAMASGVDGDIIPVRIIPKVTLRPIATVTTDATAGARTYTAAELLGGLILRDPAGGARSDVTPTATLIVGAIPNCAVGTSFEFTIRNTADAAETITVTAGTDVTLSGTMTIDQNNTKRFVAVVTDVGTPAVTVYSLGTVVH